MRLSIVRVAVDYKMVFPNTFPLNPRIDGLLENARPFVGGNMLTEPQGSAPNVFAFGNAWVQSER